MYNTFTTKAVANTTKCCVPSGQPTSVPTGEPSGQPTCVPTGQPTSVPTGEPSGQPTCVPTVVNHDEKILHFIMLD